MSARAMLETALAAADAPAAAHVLTLRLDADARAAADAADRARAAGDDRPLLGVPITVKDNVDIAGRPTTAGSTLLADAPPATADAPALARLRAAGAVLIGRTNMTEFAFSGLGLNPHYGTPANPAFADAAHIPGGSSSGAAVAVARGIGRIAIGTDTGGSVRIPAAFCGLAGFKPTATAVPRAGILPLSTTLDTVGVIARSVADCALAFDVLHGGARTIAADAARPPRLAVVENYFWDECDDAVAAAITAALDRLVAAGATVTRIAIPELDTIAKAMAGGTIAAAEAYAWHRPFLERGRQGEYDPRVLARILGGGAIEAAGLKRLHRWRRGLIAEIAAGAAPFDALVWPTVPILAPTFAMLDDDEDYARINALVLRNSTAANLFDGCAISLPCPDAAAPVGLTLAAPGGHDDALLATAAAIETMLQR